MQFTYLPETQASFYPTIYVYINDAKYSTYSLRFYRGRWCKRKNMFGTSKTKHSSLTSAFSVLIQYLTTAKGRAYKSEEDIDYLLATYPEYLL